MKLNWAERWAVNNPLRVLLQALEVRWMREVQSLPPGSRVLEVGSGRAVGARVVIREFGPSVVHVTDLDIHMLSKARRYPGPGNHHRVRLVVADVMRLPYGSRIFHAVFGFGVLHHVVDWQGGLREISRVLIPGGFYFFEELYPALYANVLTRRVLLHPKEGRFSPSQWKEALHLAGFEITRSLEIRKLGTLGVACLISQAPGQQG